MSDENTLNFQFMQLDEESLHFVDALNISNREPVVPGAPWWFKVTFSISVKEVPEIAQKANLDGVDHFMVTQARENGLEFYHVNNPMDEHDAGEISWTIPTSDILSISRLN